MLKNGYLEKAFPEIKIKKDERQERLEEVPAEVLAKALRGMLHKDKDKGK